MAGVKEEKKPHAEDDNQSTEAVSEDIANKTVEQLEIEVGKTMHVKVYAPFKVYFDGIATSISAANETGPFDILPKHHNFMTLLNACEIVVRTESREEKIKITQGIMHVKSDIVIVFLDV